ncbi:hypothetical protein C2G38_2185913 [Gigaspora rosea]|uniref:Uncharacterized protein n=1 Tax=Gigaspora rosea TaxID=44941 RepID=A0A397V9J8_9GLOM|nr:hypothetical protein C2G38_2185913 [Gigaspora rosea]
MISPFHQSPIGNGETGVTALRQPLQLQKKEESSSTTNTNILLPLNSIPTELEKCLTPPNRKFAPYSVAALGTTPSSGKAKSLSFVNTTPDFLKSLSQEFTKSGDSSVPPNNPTMISLSQQQSNEDLPVLTLPFMLNSYSCPEYNNKPGPVPNDLEYKTPNYFLPIPKTIGTVLLTHPDLKPQTTTAQPLEDTENSNEIDTKSIDTIQEQTTTQKLSYSQALKGTRNQTQKPNLEIQQRRLDQEKR